MKPSIYAGAMVLTWCCWFGRGRAARVKLAPVPSTGGEGNNTVSTVNIDLGVCESLRAKYPDSIALPTTRSYQNENSAHWSNTTILSPSCVFAPSTAEELADGLKIISGGRTAFAIRSGGHMPNPGWNSVDNGVLISVEKLNDIKYDEASKVASVGAGLRWAQVYEFLQPYRVTVAGGTNGAPGVSGLTIGGGLSFYYGQVGYSANTVVNFQVALASGEVIDANAEENSDLFWALKGGSSNFGVVTRIDFQTLPTGQIWAGTQVYNGSNYALALEAMKEFINQEDSDPKATVQYAFPGPGVVAVQLFYDGPGDSKSGGPPSAFKPFTDITPNQSTLALTTCAAVGNASSRSMPNGLRRNFNTITFTKDVDLLVQLKDQYLASAAKFKEQGVEGFQAQIVGMALTKSFLEKSADSPAAIPVEDGELIGIIHLSSWNSEADDDKVNGWTKQITEDMKATASAAGKLHPFVYMNDAGVDQDVYAGYTSSNVQRLKDISEKYDPDRVFQVLQNGGFKLGR